jgi:glucokinase
MPHDRSVYIGTDGGATTSKIGAVWENGTPVSTKLTQRATGSELGPDGVVKAWVETVDDYLAAHALTWGQVQGVGLAVPGPFERYGVWGQTANLPPEFVGFDVHSAYLSALANRAGRPVPLMVGNDGDLGGVGEAHLVRRQGNESVLLLAPGSGLGCAYIGKDGQPLTGDFFAGMEAGHMPAALQELKVAPLPCGCGRNWGCVEMYTALAGLPHLLAEKLAEFPEHPLAHSALPMKERAFSLRNLAQEGDTLALHIFDFQARALGIHVANLVMALDPTFVVIGGGLMDPEATTEAFRNRYINVVRETALPYLFAVQQAGLRVVPAALGDLSQAIGAALAVRSLLRNAAAK